MELKEIENILRKTSEGNFAARVDESKLDTELKAIGQMLNRTLEKAAVAKELKHRADVMIQYNPMAIAILRKDKTRIHINKAYETVWRDSREELLKKNSVISILLFFPETTSTPALRPKNFQLPAVLSPFLTELKNT